MSLNYNFTDINNWEQVVCIPLSDDMMTEEEQKKVRASVHMGNAPEYMPANSKEWDEVPDEERVYVKRRNPITTALIWAALEHGFGVITEANYHEVWMRMLVMDALSGYRVTIDGERRSVTLDEVKQHIGLRTNMSKITKTQFYNNLLRRAEDRRKDQ